MNDNEYEYVKSRDYAPPNPPWVEINGDPANGAFLSFYYSDPYSDLPVRRISSETDSKSDPNIETKTYGLFSTCEPMMRSSIVNNKLKYLFFCTRRKKSRVLTGYYELKWYTLGPTIKGYGNQIGNDKNDFIIAASKARFVYPGFVLSDLTGYLEGTDLSIRFRTFFRLSTKVTMKLLSLLDHTEDMTFKYIQEIQRLEGENLKSVGYAYPTWKRKSSFSWSDAAEYLGKVKYDEMGM